MLTLTLAAAMLSPAYKPLISPREVPLHLLQRNVWHPMIAAVTFTPQRKMVRCVIEKSSSNRTLDKAVCRVLERKLKLKPPESTSTRNRYRVLRHSFYWWIGNESRPPLDAADLALTVQALPEGIGSPAIVMLNAHVNEVGYITNCFAGARIFNPGLVKAGCDEARKSFTLSPALNEDSVAVPSTQNILVSFRAE